MENKTTHGLRFGAFEFDARAGELRKGGRKVKLQGQPIQILGLLLQEPGEVITREELQKKLWPSDTFVDFEHSLNAAIKRLRDALDDSATTPRYVETLARRGYRFIYPVEATADSHGNLSETGKSLRGTPVAIRERKQRRIARGLGVGALSVSLLLAALWSYRSRDRRAEGSTAMQMIKVTESGRVSLAAISPDGRYIAYVEGRDAVTVRQLATRSEVQILPPREQVIRALSFSPDGNYIYFLEAEARNPFWSPLFRMPILGGQRQEILKDVDSPVAFSPDGERFAFTRGIPEQNRVELRIAAANGTQDRPLAVLPQAFPSHQPGAAWSPDGRTIAVPALIIGKQERYALEVVDVADGKVRELYSNAHGIDRPVWVGHGEGMALLLWEDPDPGRGQLWRISYPSGERRRMTSDLSLNGGLDGAQQGNALSVVQSTLESKIWAVPKLRELEAKPITPVGLVITDILTLPTGEIIAQESATSALWSLKGDGTGRARLGNDLRGQLTANCGDGLVLMHGHERSWEIVRTSRDGTKPKVLVAHDDLWAPACSPDGRYLYYGHLRAPARLVRMPVDGGPETEIAKLTGGFGGGKLSVSPDGKQLAYYDEGFDANSSPGVAVVSVESGATQKMPLKPLWATTPLAWSRDGKSLYIARVKDGVSNLWQLAGLGKPATQVTHFTSEEILDFALSADEKTLYVARGHTTSDVVLMRNPN
jgi:DNA-binding winged helix-turn-helix (wHTH) protein/WD40 repeat protein